MVKKEEPESDMISHSYLELIRSMLQKLQFEIIVICWWEWEEVQESCGKTWPGSLLQQILQTAAAPILQILKPNINFGVLRNETKWLCCSHCLLPLLLIPSFLKDHSTIYNPLPPSTFSSSFPCEWLEDNIEKDIILLSHDVRLYYIVRMWKFVGP